MFKLLARWFGKQVPATVPDSDEKLTVETLVQSIRGSLANIPDRPAGAGALTLHIAGVPGDETMRRALDGGNSLSITVKAVPQEAIDLFVDELKLSTAATGIRYG